MSCGSTTSPSIVLATPAPIMRLRWRHVYETTCPLTRTRFFVCTVPRIGCSWESSRLLKVTVTAYLTYILIQYAYGDSALCFVSGPEIQAIGQRLRNYIAHLSRSPKATGRLMEIQRVANETAGYPGAPLLRPVLDVKTRWGSFYLMCDRAGERIPEAINTHIAELMLKRKGTAYHH